MGAAWNKFEKYADDVWEDMTDEEMNGWVDELRTADGKAERRIGGALSSARCGDISAMMFNDGIGGEVPEAPGAFELDSLFDNDDGGFSLFAGASNAFTLAMALISILIRVRN